MFIPPQTKADQRRASDPSASAWVSANAGSGKTHVLAQRVKRLLLREIDPSRILCLTYTRAAAANMANRVFRDLAAWTQLDDDALDAAIAETGAETGPEQRALARRLFARALETPGGLKIQTIHAFCEAVLHQFPLEANIAGHFELLDGEKEAALVAEARRDMISGASAGDVALAEAFADVLDRAGEDGLDRLLGEIVQRRTTLRTFIDAIGDGQPGFLPVFEEFGFTEGDTEPSICEAAWPLPGFSPAQYREFAETARAVGAANAQKWIIAKADEAFATSDPVLRLTLATQAFLKDNGEPYGATAFNKALVARLPDIADRYGEVARHLGEAADRLATFRMLCATRSALVLADWLITRYERLKSARGFLDFNDLVARTAWLLTRDDASAWVHYKLDRGIDHILVDEAQDTSPLQWNVIRSLTQEFFAGEGAAEAEGRLRTVFAVGDEKQSIYSFQGAEPHAFAETRFDFAARVQGVGATFEHVELRQSFRSTRDVLEAVDLVFSDPATRAGLQRDDIPLRHEGVREGDAGCVEVWASLGPETEEEPDDWTKSIDEAKAPAIRLAGTIARTIRSWIGREIIDGKEPRHMRAGDILVLVRKRDAFVHALSRSLKDLGVPVAGADRLLLTDHIAVKDLVAVGRLVQQPEDDLSLAALLRSPIFGWSEEQLFDLAHGRGRRSLLSALRHRAATDSHAAKAAAEIAEWLNLAAFRPAFDFYAGLLAGTAQRTGLRARLVSRLGPEAADVIDEFLSFCRAAEETGGGELEALLSTLDRAPPEVKREMEHGRDEVRILTVHASKGLEAPVVFLVDPGSAPFHDSHLPPLLPRRFRVGSNDVTGLVWQPGAELANRAVAAVKADIRAKAEAEYRRLLYVGMTRARDRLVVCGYHGVRGRSPQTWHSVVERALSASPHAILLDAPQDCLPAWRFQVTPARTPVAVETAPRSDDDLPDIGELAPLPDPIEPPPPLRPSSKGVAVDPEFAAARSRSPVLDPHDDAAFARERGSATHRLLQSLPELAPEARPAAAARYLEHVGSAWTEAQRTALAAKVLAILDDPARPWLYGPESRAEVGVGGLLSIGGKPRSVSGKIDRLAVTARIVTILDYKTGRVPQGEPPEAHVNQVAIYAAMMREIYRDRPIEALLVYTDGPNIVELTDEALRAAVERLSTV